MEFLSRIDMFSSNGRWLGRISAERARELLVRSASVEGKRGSRVTAIRLREIGRPIKPATPLSPASYAGQRYVFRESVKERDEQVVRCYSLKEIDPADREVFTAVLASVCNGGGPN